MQEVMYDYARTMIASLRTIGRADCGQHHTDAMARAEASWMCPVEWMAMKASVASVVATFRLLGNADQMNGLGTCHRRKHEERLVDLEEEIRTREAP